MEKISERSFINNEEISKILHNNQPETDHLKAKRQENGYTVVTYKKESLQNDPSYGKYRSVIFNKDNLLVSVAPYKSAPYVVDVEESVIIEEFVEGTMINLFYDDGKWEIATRGNVGAKSKFYADASLSFRDMFLEALKAACIEGDEENQLSFPFLPKDFCFSFVLQHPENMIVQRHNVARLYLTNAFQIDRENGQATEINIRSFHFFPKQIRYPRIYYKTISSVDELIRKHCSANSPFTTMGLVFRDLKTGYRAKARNPAYEYARKLRGNQPDNLFQYLTLWKDKQIKEFLYFFPSFRPQFVYFYASLQKLHETVYDDYITCFVKKEKELDSFQPPFKYLLLNLHKHYLNDLRPNKRFVDSKEVLTFMRNMDTKLLFHTMKNWLRKG